MKRHQFSFPSALALACRRHRQTLRVGVGDSLPLGTACALRLRDAPRWRSLRFALTETLRERQA